MKHIGFSVLLIYLTTIIFISCDKGNNQSGKIVEQEMEDANNKIARGKYLVESIGCGDCHSPKIMTDKGPQQDPERMLSGHPTSDTIPEINPEVIKDWILFNHTLTAAVGPWGVSYAANITSHPTGIGSWTEEQFFRAIREGKSKGLPNGRPMLPPMPWMYFANFTDEDLSSIFAYLQSTKPVNNVPPAPKSMEEIVSSATKTSKK